MRLNILLLRMVPFKWGSSKNYHLSLYFNVKRCLLSVNIEYLTTASLFSLHKVKLIVGLLADTG